MTTTKETKIRFLGYMRDVVIYIEPSNESYKLEVYDEKTGDYTTVKIGTTKECYLAMYQNEAIEVNAFGYEEGARSYYISGRFGEFFGIHKIIHDFSKYFDKEEGEINEK
jgi:hypothetical protein